MPKVQGWMDRSHKGWSKNGCDIRVGRREHRPWRCTINLWDLSWPRQAEGAADALVLFRLSGDPFNATALWLLKAVAVCQPDLF